MGEQSPDQQPDRSEIINSMYLAYTRDTLELSDDPLQVSDIAEEIYLQDDFDDRSQTERDIVRNNITIAMNSLVESGVVRRVIIEDAPRNQLPHFELVDEDDDQERVA